MFPFVLLGQDLEQNKNTKRAPRVSLFQMNPMSKSGTVTGIVLDLNLAD